MKGIVDKETCIGCGLCPSVCDEIFEMDDDGKAVGSSEDIPDSILETAKEAEEGCPVDAITIK